MLMMMMMMMMMMVVVVVTVVQVGATNASAIVSDEAIQSFALRHKPQFFLQQSKSESAFRRWFFDTEQRIAPAFVVFDSIFLFMSMWLPLLFLISSSSLIFNVSALLMLYSYVVLKRRTPDGWLYSYGWIGALAMTACPVGITTTMYVPLP
jgi:hypothetical protein